MPANKCIPCLGLEVKEAIAENLAGSAIKQVLEQIPTCPGEKDIQMCVKPPRKKSAYQEFAGNCLREMHLKKFDPNAMRECARQWREKKKVT